VTEAGYDPEVIRVYSFGELPDITPGRREVRRLSGQSRVPVLVTDDGEVVTGSSQIVAWARGHPSARVRTLSASAERTTD
jgi:glutathione S-transferase